MVAPFIAAIPGIVKGAAVAHPYLTALYAYMAAQMGLGEISKFGERGMSREQMRAQIQMQKASAEATKMSVKESRARSKEYMETLLKTKKEERQELRDIESMRSFQQSQDRQIALILQAVQTMGQRQGASASAPGGGMLGLMRGGF